MQCFKFRSKGSVCVLHICQIGFVSARGYILICPADYQMSVYSLWFNCIAGKMCLKSFSLNILHHNRSHWPGCSSHCPVPGRPFREAWFIFWCTSALYLKMHKLTFDESLCPHWRKHVHMLDWTLPVTGMMSWRQRGILRCRLLFTSN